MAACWGVFAAMGLLMKCEHGPMSVECFEQRRSVEGYRPAITGRYVFPGCRGPIDMKIDFIRQPPKERFMSGTIPMRTDISQAQLHRTGE